jgi:hypothetical protein
MTARAILVKFLEAGLEISFGKLTGIVHLGEGVLDEELRLLFVELARVVLVVLGPDVVNALSDHCINVCHS